MSQVICVGPFSSMRKCARKLTIATRPSGWHAPEKPDISQSNGVVLQATNWLQSRLLAPKFNLSPENDVAQKAWTQKERIRSDQESTCCSSHFYAKSAQSNSSHNFKCEHELPVSLNGRFWLQLPTFEMPIRKRPRKLVLLLLFITLLLDFRKIVSFST